MNLIPQLVLNSIIAGSIIALVALGFNLIYASTKFFNLAHGAMVTLGGYAVFFLYKHLGLNIYVSVLIGVVVAGLAGYLLDKLIFLPLRKKKASNMILLVASLGAFTALQAIIAILFSSQFQTYSDAFENQKIFTIAGGTITEVQVIILVLSIGIMLGLALMLKKTKFGRAIVAISDDEEVAKIVGIDTNKLIGYVFFIGSSIAGLAGIFVGFDTGIDPIMGMGLLLQGVIASIIGGVGNVYAGVLGAFVLGFIQNFGIWKISGEWKDAITFGVLILFLIFRPQGIIKK
jgi:branched-chain amino acid transport system permease protein